jgi:hypothetical protein
MGECEKYPSTLERYQQRFSRVLALIEARSEEPLSLEALSDLASGTCMRTGCPRAARKPGISRCSCSA